MKLFQLKTLWEKTGKMSAEHIYQKDKRTHQNTINSTQGQTSQLKRGAKCLNWLLSKQDKQQVSRCKDFYIVCHQENANWKTMIALNTH